MMTVEDPEAYSNIVSVAPAEHNDSQDTDSLFAVQYIVETKQILDGRNHFIWRKKPGRDFTASQA